MASEQVLVQDILPSFLLHLALPEIQKVLVVLLHPQILLEMLRIAHVLHVSLLNWIIWTLVGCVVLVLLLDDGSWCTKSV